MTMPAPILNLADATLRAESPERAPRGNTAAPSARHSASAISTSAASRGRITPIGSCL